MPPTKTPKEPKVKVAKPKKPKEPSEPFFQAAVSCYFQYCVEKFDAPPSFIGSAPRDLRTIIKQLRLRAEAKGVEWTEFILVHRLRLFLDEAWSDSWRQHHWMLSVLVRNFDAIIFNASKKAKLNK